MSAYLILFDGWRLCCLTWKYPNTYKMGHISSLCPILHIYISAVISNVFKLLKCSHENVNRSPLQKYVKHTFELLHLINLNPNKDVWCQLNTKDVTELKQHDAQILLHRAVSVRYSKDLKWEKTLVKGVIYPRNLFCAVTGDRTVETMKPLIWMVIVIHAFTGLASGEINMSCILFFILQRPRGSRVKRHGSRGLFRTDSHLKSWFFRQPRKELQQPWKYCF